MPEMSSPASALAGADHILAELVGFDTTSSKPNRPLIDHIHGFLKQLGVAADIVTDGDGGKACLWATLGPPSGAADGGVVLAGHSDVVPVEGQAWTSAPFTLTERDGKLYGRGAVDMKGFIACALAFVREAVGEGRRLAAPVHLAFTHDEETDMSGARRLAAWLSERGARPGWIWIGEPTTMRLIGAHKGVYECLTEFTGVAGHTSEPDAGVNAAELAHDFIGVVRAAARQKQENPIPGSAFRPPYTTIVPSVVKGGVATNVIPSSCCVNWQIRAHPGDDAHAIRAEIERNAAAIIDPCIAAFAGRAGVARWPALKTTVRCDVPPFVGDPGSRAVAALAGPVGHQGAPEVVSFGTEAGIFQGTGASVVVCGPGGIDKAHNPDEYVETAQLALCMDALRKVFRV